MTEYQAIFALGSNFFIQGQYEKAQIIFAGLIALDPKQREPAIAYGEALMISGQIEKALTHFLMLYERWNDDSRVVLSAAKANILLGKIDDAKKLLHILTTKEADEKNTSALAKSLFSLI